MTWLQQHVAGLICRFTSHEVDWPRFYNGGGRCCMHCLSPMPEPPCIVGKLHPDQGD